MKDCSGQVLTTGQEAATTRNGYTCCLDVCVVVGFTNKKVRLKCAHEYKKNEYEEILKFPEQLCIVRRWEDM